MTGTLDLEIPGYEGKLVARYGRVTKAEAHQALRLPFNQRVRLDKGFDRKLLRASADLLARCCLELLRRDDARLLPLAEQSPSAGPIGFDARLAELLELEATEPREIVFGVFVRDVAVLAHAGKLMTWLEEG